MDISIKFIDKKSKGNQGFVARKGQIKISNYTESFEPSFDWWTLDDYERQWKEGIERLKNNAQSCLVATVFDPRIKPWIEWYVMYKVNNQIHIRPQAIFGQNYRDRVGIKAFTPDTCYDFIPLLQGSGSGTQKISEWIVAFDSQK